MVYLIMKLAGKYLNRYFPGKTAETKKCGYCLRRVDLHYVRCPYCGRGDFLYNDG